MVREFCLQKSSSFTIKSSICIFRLLILNLTAHWNFHLLDTYLKRKFSLPKIFFSNSNHQIPSCSIVSDFLLRNLIFSSTYNHTIINGSLSPPFLHLNIEVFIPKPHILKLKKELDPCLISILKKNQTMIWNYLLANFLSNIKSEQILPFR